jgi:hypothetical protein
MCVRARPSVGMRIRYTVCNKGFYTCTLFNIEYYGTVEHSFVFVCYLTMLRAWTSAASRRVSGWIPSVSLGIFSVATDGTMCPGVDSVSKNEY